MVCESGYYNEGCDTSPPGSCVPCEECNANEYMLIGSSTDNECGGIFPGKCQTCASCPAGVYREGCGQHSAGSCEECAVGTYKESEGTEACGDCECGTGTYIKMANTGATSCSCEECAGCEAGKYRAECGGVRAGQCTDCPVGKFKIDDSSNPCTATCEDCAAGYYRKDCGGFNAGFCAPCQDDCHDGEYRQGCTGISAGSCTTCPGCDPGTSRIDCYNQSIGSCADCAAGKYKSTFGSEACKECSCSALQYHIEACGGAESGKCAFCEVGKYLDPTQQACVPCSGGTYALPGMDTCRLCANGKYSLMEASTCLYCEAGKYAVANAAACSACEAGTFSAEGRSTCTACPAGRYSGSTASVCLVCDAGTYASLAASVCTECVAGTYSGRASASCFSCPMGTYTSTTKSTQCTACAVNTFSAQLAASSAQTCQPCNESLYAALGASTCSFCGAGSRILQRDALETCEVCALQSARESASRFGEACPVACTDDACVKSFLGEVNSTRNISMREHIAAVYGARAAIESALMAMEGTWEHTQLDTRVTESYRGHECGLCARILDPIRNQPVPLESYRVAGAEGSCAPKCDSSMQYYARSEYPGTCVLCDKVCGTGEYLTGDACQSCLSCLAPVDENWHFTGQGALDDNVSCPWACNEGYFLDYVLDIPTAGASVREACLRHTVLTCGGGQYQVRGTNLSDAYCEECQVSCEGRRQTAACSAFADTSCSECLPALATLEAGAAYEGTNCTRACRSGYVMNQASGRCEFCAAECDPGSFAPADRRNCTDCRACADVLPTNASYVDACTWACDEGFFFTHGDCFSLAVELSSRRQSETRCAQGERLVWQATFFACEACDVPLPAAPVDSTWRWLPSRSSCAWECLPGYYRAQISATLVDCLAWEAYQMQIITGASPTAAGEDPAAVSATTINNVDEIEFRREEREYATLSIAEFAVLAGFVFGTLMLLVVTQT